MGRADTSVHFRAPAAEVKIIKEAAKASGLLSDGEWFRVVLLAAAGERTLSEQLRRASAAGKRKA